MQPFRFYLVTDTHYYDNALGSEGEAYDAYMRYEQMCLRENSAILKAVFRDIAADKSTDIVILPGDLSKDGQKQCHLSFLRELEALKSAGKKIYVITARHDFNDHATGFLGSERVPVEGTTREELYDLYKEYGFSDALAVDRESLSYVAEIVPGVRMLALNSDGAADGHDRGSFDERLSCWIREQAKDAKTHGAFLFAINHYPVIPPAGIFELVDDAKMKNWQSVASLLADSGVPIVFTGHMHIQSIKHFVSQKGNGLYDICTSALVGSPAMYRKVEFFGEDKVKIESLPVPPFDWDREGLSNEAYFNRQFDGMILNRIADILSGGKGAVKLLKSAGSRAFRTLTLGGVGRLLFVRVDKSIRKVPLKDFAVSLVRSIFAGDPPYKKGTPENEAARKALSRLSPVLRLVEKKLLKAHPGLCLKDLILSSMGNDSGISDNNATLTLDALQNGTEGECNG